MFGEMNNELTVQPGESNESLSRQTLGLAQDDF